MLTKDVRPSGRAVNAHPAESPGARVPKVACASPAGATYTIRDAVIELDDPSTLAPLSAGDRRAVLYAIAQIHNAAALQQLAWTCEDVEMFDAACEAYAVAVEHAEDVLTSILTDGHSHDENAEDTTSDDAGYGYDVGAVLAKLCAEYYGEGGYPDRFRPYEAGQDPITLFTDAVRGAIKQMLWHHASHLPHGDVRVMLDAVEQASRAQLFVAARDAYRYKKALLASPGRAAIRRAADARYREAMARVQFES